MAEIINLTNVQFQDILRALGLDPTDAEYAAAFGIPQNAAEHAAKVAFRKKITEELIMPTGYSARIGAAQFRALLIATGRDPDDPKYSFTSSPIEGRTHEETLHMQELNAREINDIFGFEPPPPGSTTDPDTIDTVLGVDVSPYIPMLETYELQELIPKLDEWVRLYGDQPDYIRFLITQEDAYKERFVVNERRKARGYTTLSPEQILGNENTYRGILRSAGLPKGFYDSFEDFVMFMEMDMSPSELSERVSDGFDMVQTLAAEIPEIAAFMTEMFGDASPTAMATFFLDPDNSLELLLKERDAMLIGGRASQFDMDFDPDRARYLASMGVNDARAIEAFSRVASLEPLLTETFSEADDFTAEQEGVDTALGFDQTKLKDRLDKRVANATRGGTPIVDVQEGIKALS